jgi:hypothetical protein
MPAHRPAIYIAHPLGAGPDRERNRENAARWVAWFARTFLIAPVATWVTLAGEWDESAENRKLGLEIDLALIAACEEVWLVGGRISPGMAIEAEEARRLGKRVIDLTGFGFEAPEPGAFRVSCRMDSEITRQRKESA